MKAAQTLPAAAAKALTTGHGAMEAISQQLQVRQDGPLAAAPCTEFINGRRLPTGDGARSVSACLGFYTMSQRVYGTVLDAVMFILFEREALGFSLRTAAQRGVRTVAGGGAGLHPRVSPRLGALGAYSGQVQRDRLRLRCLRAAAPGRVCAPHKGRRGTRFVTGAPGPCSE